MTRKQMERNGLMDRIAGVLSRYEAVMPSRHDLVQYVNKHLGPVSVTVSPTSREVALLTYEVARRLKDQNGRKKFMSAKMMNGNGKVVRRFVQMPLATDDQRRGIVESMAEVAIRQIHATNHAAIFATELGTQIALPFPEYAEAEERDGDAQDGPLAL